MPNDQSIEPEFIGRSGILKTVINRWHNCLNGEPQFLLIEGHPGRGKTRLIQKFYQYLTEEYDLENYWKPLPKDSHKAMAITPLLRREKFDSLPSLPFLWAASRCVDNIYKNEKTLYSNSAYEIKRQIEVHLFLEILKKSKKDKNKKLFKSSASLLTSIAIPGSGAVFEILNQVLDGTGLALSISDFLGETSRFKDNITNSTTTQEDIFNNDIRDFSKQLFDLLQLSYKKVDVPIIIIVDDLHWVDDTTIKILSDLWRLAQENKFKIMIWASSWPLDFKLDTDFFKSPLLPKFYQSLKASGGEIFRLQRLQKKQLFKIIEERIPKASIKQKILIVGRSDGDIDLLNDFIDEILATPGWVDESGVLLADELDITSLPSKAADMSRRKIRRLSQDLRLLLSWSSAQGITFEYSVLEAIAKSKKFSSKITEQLSSADHTHGIIQVGNSPEFSLNEFRKVSYFEASREMLSRFFDGQDIMKLIIASYEEGLLQTQGDIFNDDIFERRAINYTSIVTYFSKIFEKNDVFFGQLACLCLTNLSRGVLTHAQEFAEDIIKYKSNNRDHMSLAYRTLSRIFYLRGENEHENTNLELWETYDKEDNPERMLLKADYLCRKSECKTSLQILDRVISNQQEPLWKFKATIQKAYTLWFTGRPEHALTALRNAEEIYEANHPLLSLKKVQLDHTACLILHDMEKSNQVAVRSQRCIKHYDGEQKKYETLIAQVNFADALWAAGKTKQADRLLLRVYNSSIELELPHVEDISAICYANVLSSRGETEKALEFYQSGVELAQKISHVWDYLYGSIYMALCRFEIGHTDFAEFLKELNIEEISQYQYLSALRASCIKIAEIIKNEKHEIHNDSYDWLSYDNAQFPILELYKNANELSLLPKNSPPKYETLTGFTTALSKCEGVKIRPLLIFEVLERVLKTHASYLDDNQLEFLLRWQQRYFPISNNMDVQKLPKKFSSCDFTKCEARCCYDGVYLQEGEEHKINELVKNNPSYFIHLSPDFIVDGHWGGKFKGRKTAVRPFEYKSPDFPTHYNKSRCVFCTEIGACSLESYSREHTDWKWTYKPITCRIHPVALSKDHNAAPPPTNIDEDECDTGLNYPGYTIFSPCGQSRNKGTQWEELFEDEIKEVQKLIAPKKHK